MPNDKRFYALYAKCQDLGIPVTIHTSINFSNDRSIEFGRPLALCEIACDFPNLTLVANHGGWPWVPELIAIAWKHRNVYIEIGAISPKYIGLPGSGWEMLLRYGNSLLQDQVLFATDCMIPVARAVEELRALPLKEEVKPEVAGRQCRPPPRGRVQALAGRPGHQYAVLSDLRAPGRAGRGIPSTAAPMPPASRR